MSDPPTFHDRLSETMGQVLVGYDDVTRAMSVALMTRGHVLLEGLPGVAKTTMAKLFARVSGLEVARIQMTPDVLPADLTGTYVYSEDTGSFDLRRGPVFADVVIADEINRATPKTQSALLEAMQERQVTIEGETHDLGEPYIVMATQNPIEMEGTFSLPAAQRDRFQHKLTVSLPSREVERRLLDRFDTEPDLGPESIEAQFDQTTIQSLREQVAEVYVAPVLKEYVLDLVAETRAHADIEYGASPRATINTLQATKGQAAINGRAYAIPDDVKDLFPGLMAHRLVLTADAELNNRSTEDVIEDILTSVPTPADDDVESAAAQTPVSPDLSD